MNHQEKEITQLWEQWKKSHKISTHTSEDYMSFFMATKKNEIQLFSAFTSSDIDSWQKFHVWALDNLF